MIAVCKLCFLYKHTNEWTMGILKTACINGPQISSENHDQVFSSRLIVASSCTISLSFFHMGSQQQRLRQNVWSRFLWATAEVISSDVGRHSCQITANCYHSCSLHTRHRSCPCGLESGHYLHFQKEQSQGPEYLATSHLSLAASSITHWPRSLSVQQHWPGSDSELSNSDVVCQILRDTKAEECIYFSAQN